MPVSRRLAPQRVTKVVPGITGTPEIEPNFANLIKGLAHNGSTRSGKDNNGLHYGK